MDFKLIASGILIGGALMFSGIQPSDLLEQGSDVWGRFTGDFMAILNGEAQEKLAREARDNTTDDMQAICDTDPVDAGEQSATIVQDINLVRCETIRNTKAAIANPEELKQRLDSQNLTVEDLKKRWEESRKIME